jgi:hypothetical protein
MIKSILSATILSLVVVSAAWALPAPSNTQLPPLSSTDVIQVGHGHGGGGNYHGNKNYNYKHYNYNYNYHGGGRYHYGNKYWGHRYNYRPYGWETLGCIAVGPVWYCP